ncbi:MAG: penicillin-binding protein 2 [Eggerthellaceae bacterium]|nr:penicillin-binding protein 2 [Eggerthellaceae bacterium]
MTVALIAGIITAVILVGAVLIYLTMRNKASDSSATEDALGRELTNVKVGLDEAQGGNDGAKDVKVASGGASAKVQDSSSKRFYALGALAAGVFAALTARIWSLQVKSGKGYAEEAQDNLLTTTSTPAPRGCIYDVRGRELVTNRSSQTVLADPKVADDQDVIMRLAAVLGIPAPIVSQRIKDAAGGAQSQRVVAEDVRLRDVAFIAEHADAFSGISCETRTVREYPHGGLAAHVLGYTGSPTDDELAQAGFGRNIQSTDSVGKSGVELTYDGILSGDQGERRMMVDAKGNVVAVVGETMPEKGSDLHLTIDAYAQSVADQVLAERIAPLGDIGTGVGVGGAIVAMNVKDGSIPVMASYPTFDPSYFTNGIPQDIWDLYNTDESNAPMVNRVVNGQYAPASTFKAFTSLAGLHHGYADYEMEWECGGAWDGFGSGDIQKCWLHSGHGFMDLHDGIVNSCDVVFYEIAKAFYDHGPEGTGEVSETALQDYLAQFRFGNPTGVDLPDESAGRIPTPEWKQEHWRNVPSEAYWRGGDYTNMIIGQGDVLITPLQLAMAYGAIATGDLMKPHVMKEIRNSDGDVVVTAEPEVIGHPDVNQEDLEYVRESLHDMISESHDAWPSFAAQGLDAAGKSGTSEHTDRQDDAWFVAYAPYDDPKYVVACILEEGRSGAEFAGPIVARVLGALFKGEGEDAETLEVASISGSSGRSVAVKSAGGSRTD